MEDLIVYDPYDDDDDDEISMLCVDPMMIVDVDLNNNEDSLLDTEHEGNSSHFGLDPLDSEVNNLTEMASFDFSSQDDNTASFDECVPSSSQSHYMHVFKSQKGKTKLSLDGFSFTRNRVIKDVSYWCCEQRYSSLKCSATCSTVNGANDRLLLKRMGSKRHTHGPDPYRLPVATALNGLSDRAIAQVRSKPCQLIHDFKASPEVAHIRTHVGSSQSLRRMIERKRKKGSGLPQEPATLDYAYDIAFSSLDEESIILADWLSPDKKKRITIFGTERTFDYLCRATLWMSDGTFKITPRLFYQFFTIHGNIDDDYAVYPLVFILLSGKDQDTYNQAIGMLVKLANDHNKLFNIRNHISDFEIAISNAIENWFPSVSTTACYFHLTQSVLRRIKTMGLYKRYISNLPFAQEIHCILALAYLSPQEIPDYFNALFPTMSVEGKQFAEWFGNTYIEARSGLTPRFPPIFWSVADLIEKNLPKSQSRPEAFHHSIHVTLGEEHVKLYKLINFLKDRIVNIYCDIDHHLEGNVQLIRSAKYEKAENAIKSVLARKNGENHIEILRGISRHISL